MKLRLRDIASQMAISKEAIDEIYRLEPRRICFSTTHKNALMRHHGQGDYIGRFYIPYPETIYPIFYKMTDIQLFQSQKYNNYWRSIQSIEEFEKIKGFVDDLKDIMFLRDTLALSIALSININEDNNRTEIGELEYQAKYNSDENAIRQLTERCIEIWQKLPYYKDVVTFCAVPPSKNGENNLPNKVVSMIEHIHNINNISSILYWENIKPSLQFLPLNEKWIGLENANLCVNGDLTGKTIILIDDLYQSGMTMQYVAMKLQQAGAAKIYGIALVKSRRDTDNQ